MANIEINYVYSHLSDDLKPGQLEVAAKKSFDLCAQHLGIKQSLEISIDFADNAQMQYLNKTFMGKDKPTNVLSFPSLEIKHADFSAVTDDDLYLGDIAISDEIIAKEALEQNKLFIDHFTHMMVHSFLHLCGFDHMQEDEATKMESMEIDILQKMGIKNPYN